MFIQIFICQGAFIVTSKQQKFPPALQNTRTASHYHFEIPGSWWSHWGSTDTNMVRTWSQTWAEKCLVGSWEESLTLGFSASLFHWPLKKAVWNESVITGQGGEKRYLKPSRYRVLNCRQGSSTFSPLWFGLTEL